MNPPEDTRHDDAGSLPVAVLDDYQEVALVVADTAAFWAGSPIRVHLSRGSARRADRPTIR